MGAWQFDRDRAIVAAIVVANLIFLPFILFEKETAAIAQTIGLDTTPFADALGSSGALDFAIVVAGGLLGGVRRGPAG